MGCRSNTRNLNKAPCCVDGHQQGSAEVKGGSAVGVKVELGKVAEIRQRRQMEGRGKSPEMRRPELSCGNTGWSLTARQGEPAENAQVHRR